MLTFIEGDSEKKDIKPLNPMISGKLWYKNSEIFLSQIKKKYFYGESLSGDIQLENDQIWFL